MGVVKYATGIDYVKGSLAKPKKKDGHSCGTYLIGTHREKETSNPNCTRLFVKDANAYDRSTPLSSKERQNRVRFTAVKEMVAARKENLQTLSQDQMAFVAQKDTAGGKKTFNAYLWAICGAEYDAQHS